MKKTGRVIGIFLLACILVLTAAGCSQKAEVSQEQQRLFAFGAVMAVRDGTGFDTLSGIMGVYKNAYIEGLESSWDVYDHASAVETLDWLQVEGHRLPVSDEYYGFDEIFAIASGQQLTNESELELLDEEMRAFDITAALLMDGFDYTEDEIMEIKTVSAWDLDRMVTLSRWCYGLEYITEEEMWSYINWAADKAVQDYDSWRHYFAGVMFGRAIWDPEADIPEENGYVCEELLSSSDSVYQKHDFKVSTATV